MPAYSIEEELNILDPKKVSIGKDEFNRLNIKIEGGKEYPEVDIVMDFPLTNSDHFLSVIEVNNGKRDEEIGIIEDIRKLDSKSRKIVKEEIKRIYFMPKVTKINRLKENHGIMKFDLETEKGHREFETRHREDIRKLPGGRIIIRDADGNRFEIKDYRKLDRRSMLLVDTEI